MIKITRFLYVQWSVLPLLALAYVTNSLHTVGMAYAVVMVHELFHLFAALLLRERVGTIIIMPFGITLRLSASVIRSSLHEFCIALAGPFANCLMLLGAYLLQKFIWQDSAALWLFNYVNLVTLVLNLLPCLPLDGGRALKAVLTRQLGYIAAISVMRRLSRIVTIILFVCGALLLLVTGLNISLLMVAAFLTLYMTEEKKENDYVIMQELLYTKNKLKNRGLMRTQCLTATDALAARSLLKWLCYDAYHIVYVVDKSQHLLRTVTEAQIVEALTEKGWHITLGDVR